VRDVTRNKGNHDGRSDTDTDTDSCLPYRWVTQPPQHPGGGGRADERSNSDIIFEDWWARPVALPAERVASTKSDECQHVAHPDDTDSHAYRNTQTHERTLR